LAWADLGAGLAFFLIFEGLLPFASPQSWRRALAMMAELEDRQLKTIGLIAIGLGCGLLFLIRL
jgi:uncharacterized protein YjeT (DUF2065 family)